MLHAGLDLSRRKVDVCLLVRSGRASDQLACAPDADAMRTLARRIGEVYREPDCAVIESMIGARVVHDTLEQEGWDVEIADAQKVKGLAPLACKTDRIDSRVLGERNDECDRDQHEVPRRAGLDGVVDDEAGQVRRRRLAAVASTVAVMAAISRRRYG
jgi:hypothetical protein